MGMVGAHHQGPTCYKLEHYQISDELKHPRESSMSVWRRCMILIIRFLVGSGMSKLPQLLDRGGNWEELE
jgi:hypothetical protein